jgi:predicted permease
MSFMRRALNLFFRSHVEETISAELQSHIDMRTEEKIREGMGPDDARRSARLQFGNPVVVKEQMASVDLALGLDSVFRDFQYAIRRLRRSPVFVITVVATLALGIGANTAVFSIVDAVLLRPLPYKLSDRLVVVWQTDAAHRGTGAWFNAYREFQEWKQDSRSFERLAAMTWATPGSTLTWHNRRIGLFALPATTDFFSMLGVQAELGRTFEDDDAKSPCTLVLAYPFWSETLGAARDIVGQNVTVDNSSCIVIGVMPKSFSFYPKEANAWSLITPSGPFAKKPWESMTGVFGLLKPGVSRSQAQDELNAMQKRIQPEVPPALSQLAATTAIVLNLHDNFTWLAGRNLRTGLLVLLGAVGIVLMMACLNVAALVLGRALEQAPDIAIRAALGSDRLRLVRQMLTESFVVAAGGTLLGLLLASVMVLWFRSTNPVELPPGTVVSLDWRVLLFASIAGVGSVVLFGLAPALRASRADLNSILKNGGRGAGVDISAHRTSQVLVTAQIGLSLMLVVGAGLLAVSLWKMASTSVGYRTNQVLTGTISLPPNHYGAPDATTRLTSTLEHSVSALPGVESVVAASYFTPLGEDPIAVKGEPLKSSNGGIFTQTVTANFFHAMQIPMLRGRVFDSRDQRDRQQVAMINQALAEKYFPNSDPVGHIIKLSHADDASKPWLTVIGVVADVKTTTVFQEMGYVEQPTVYRPIAQDPPATLALMVLTKRNVPELIGEIETELTSIDRDLVLADVGTLDGRLSATRSQPRFRAVLFGGFAGLALLLAVVGLYGLMAQMVSRRTREIAIRMALGADRRAVLRGVFARALSLASAGICLGVIGSAFAVRSLSGMLYGVHAENPGMFLLASTLMAVIAIIASWNPARRAAAVDPMRTLRSE